MAKCDFSAPAVPGTVEDLSTVLTMLEELRTAVNSIDVEQLSPLFELPPEELSRLLIWSDLNAAAGIKQTQLQAYTKPLTETTGTLPLTRVDDGELAQAQNTGTVTLPPLLNLATVCGVAAPATGRYAITGSAAITDENKAVGQKVFQGQLAIGTTGFGPVSRVEIPFGFGAGTHPDVCMTVACTTYRDLTSGQTVNMRAGCFTDGGSVLTNRGYISMVRVS